MPSWFNVIYSTFLHIELYSWELSFWFHGCVAFSWHVFIHSFIQVFWNKEIGGGGCGWRRNLEIEAKFSEQNFCNRDSQASFDQVMVAFFSLSLPQLLRLLSWCQDVINVRHPQASSHFRRIWGHRLGVGERQLSETLLISLELIFIFWQFCFLFRSLAHAVTSVSADWGIICLFWLWSLSFIKPHFLGNRLSASCQQWG